MGEAAVVVDQAWKRFTIYRERNQYLKTSVLRGRRARTEEFWAVKGVSFEVPEGETFGIIGHNGSGKSTLLKCLARILRPDKGTVAVNGQMSALLELGAGFHPELSGRENVFLNGSILGLSRKQVQSKLDEIIDFAGLEQFIDTPVKNYSSGMYVRLGFAVAIHVDPEVLLIDEVLAVGDEAFQRKCAEKITDFRTDGRTIVIVSHGLGQLRSLCDRVAWLDHGELRRLGPASDVIDEYSGVSHADRVETARDGVRWGTGEARITKIELLDAAGAPTPRCRSGEDVTFRLHYHADEPVPNGTFGFALFTLDGAMVSGPNSREAGVTVDRLDGEGWVDLRFHAFPLLEGTYDVSAGISDPTLLHTYDLWQRPFRFDVLRGEPWQQHGLVHLHPRWSVHRSHGGAAERVVEVS